MERLLRYIVKVIHLIVLKIKEKIGRKMQTQKRRWVILYKVIGKNLIVSRIMGYYDDNSSKVHQKINY